MQSIEYLNLEINRFHPHRIQIDQHRFDCNFSSNVNHLLHSEDGQLNTLVDLQINLAQNIKKNREVVDNYFRILADSLKDKVKLLKDIDSKLDYIRDQNKIILEKFSFTSSSKNLPEEDKDNIKKIEDIIEKFGKVNLDKGKAVQFDPRLPRKPRKPYIYY